MAAPNIPAIIKARMDADSGLVGPGNTLPGLVWTQPFKRGKTLEVFPDEVHYAAAARITDGSDQPLLFGIEGTIPGAENRYPEVRFIAEAHEGGKQAIRDAVERVKQLFDQWYYAPTGHAPLFFFVFGGATPISDSEEFVGACQSTLTMGVTTRWTTVSSY